MAHLWFRDAEAIWSAMPLEGGVVNVAVDPPRVLAEGALPGDDAPATVIRAEMEGAPVWVLLATGDGDVRVNGYRPVAGMRVLQDRDEIRAGLRGPFFFSTETLAHVEEFPGADRAVYCGRCRQPMGKGLAVQCPQCKIWFHQSEALPCWTYAPTCAFCQQPTALDAGFDWMPEA